MDLGFALTLHRELRDARSIFGYSGPFPDEHSARLIELGEAVLASPETAPASRGRLGYVMVEAYQNIIRHRSEHIGANGGDGRSLFMLRCGDNGQRVITRNPILTQQVGKLDDLLTELQSKDNTALKRRFFEEIQRASQPGARGAGLGLIEMIRRSDGRAMWDFAPIDAAHASFTLALDLGDMPVVARSVAGDALLSDQVMEHRVSLFHAGKWSSALQDVLLGFATRESPLNAQQRQERTRIFGSMANRALTIIRNDRPVMLVIQKDEGDRLSIGAVIGEADAQRLSRLFSAGNDGVSFQAMPAEDGILAMVQAPW